MGYDVSLPGGRRRRSDLDGVQLASPMPAMSPARRKGRGSTTNPANRFEARDVAPFDDGWATLASDFADLPPLPTELIRDTTRSIISRNQSPDIGFEQSINPYRGCEHGCVYCYARPTHSYLGYSAGVDFETKILYKPDAARLLEAELRKPGYVAKPIVLGSNTDPYQPVDRTLKLTRSILEVLHAHNHPVTIVTKSAGMLRDLDILQPMAARNLARVYVSVTTLDNALARRMEPRAAAPARRLDAISALASAGVPAAVLAAPMIPGLNDSELESILAASAKAGAAFAGYVLLRLPLEVAGIFQDWLQQHFPDRATRVLSLIRETRSGALNASGFGERFRGTGVYADLLADRFARSFRQHAFSPRTDLDCTLFKVPGRRASVDALQLTLI